jgi:ankyrin repeat protein
MNGRLDRVQALLKKGVDVNAKSPIGTPLMMAAWGGRLEVMKLLLQKGADVNFEIGGETALKKAMENTFPGKDQIEVAKLLVEHGAKPRTLAEASFAGDMAAVQRFLAEGTDLDYRSRPDD